MPRTARRISKTGFYHIIIRGVNKENIFIDDEDKKKFLQLLKYYKTQFDCKVYAYCLMSNHVHLLIEDRYLKIGDFMRNITSIYAGEFNKKHGRIGHLFQSRYKSQNIETQSYLVRLIRYIHRNPEKAGISKTQDYNWSSYKEVLYGAKIIDRNFILNIYNDNKFYAINEFIKQMTTYSFDMIDSAYIDDKVSDMQVKAIVQDMLETKVIPEVTKENMNEVIYKIKQIKNISKDQIFRVLEIKKATFYKKLKK